MSKVYFKDIEDTWKAFERRCAAARVAGGISERERMMGVVVPDDWWYDELTHYYIPKDVELF